MRRREFLGLIGGAAAWTLAVHAQQTERVRRIGILMNLAADDPQAMLEVAGFVQGLQEFGWIVGRNVRLDYRWGMGDPENYHHYAAELVALTPDVILASNTSTIRALQHETHTIPLVFAGASDPVGGGLVASLARPGGNITGFTTSEFGSSGKWLELLKQISPRMIRAAVLRDSTTTGGVAQFAAIQTIAAPLGVELSPIDVHDAGKIENGLTEFARVPNGGLIVVSTALAAVHRELIIALAARLSLPAIYPFRFFVDGGGLIAYGPDRAEPFRRAAGYVDRILKGERPSDLPVQQPTRYELTINLKTAKALGLTIPPSLLATADEVIE